jgi:HEAT repeat protein
MSRPIRQRVTAAFLLIGIATACGESDRAFGGRSASSWARDLQSPDEGTRLRAADAFYQIVPHASANVRALLIAMRDSVPEVQATVANALSRIGQEGIPALIEAVGDDHASVRALAIGLLAAKGDTAVAAIPAILPALSDTSADVRIAAAAAIGWLGRWSTRRSELADRLGTTVRDREPGVRAASLDALAELRVDPDSLGRTLRIALHDSSATVRQAAVRSLLIVAMSPSELLSTVSPLTRDESSGVRLAAYQVIASLTTTGQGPAAKALLQTGLQDPNDQVKGIVERLLNPPPPSRIR